MLPLHNLTYLKVSLLKPVRYGPVSASELGGKCPALSRNATLKVSRFVAVSVPLCSAFRVSSVFRLSSISVRYGCNLASLR